MPGMLPINLIPDKPNAPGKRRCNVMLVTYPVETGGLEQGQSGANPGTPRLFEKLHGGASVMYT